MGVTTGVLGVDAGANGVDETEVPPPPQAASSNAEHAMVPAPAIRRPKSDFRIDPSAGLHPRPPVATAVVTTVRVDAK